MAGPFDFMHIKGRTAGSSNELSFDVLDAARSDYGKKRKKDKKASKASTPAPSQGSYHGVSGTATLSAAPEVERRKRERRTHSLKLGFVAAIAVVALVGAAGYFGYTYMMGQQNFTGSYDSLINRFRELDKTIVQVDAIMANPYDSGQMEAEANLLDKFPQMTRELNALTAEARSMKELTSVPEDTAALSGVESAATARKDMLSAAEGAFTLSKQVKGVAYQADKVWSSVSEADAKAREATEIANAASTQEETQQARDATVEAYNLFEEALISLQDVGNQTPGTVFDLEISYLKKRVAALDAAIDTEDALLSGDRNTAEAKNETYNDADAEAAMLAARFETSPGRQVREAFQVDMTAWQEKYQDARAEAATADATVRSYL